jgi:hypothetical protein
MSIGGAILGSSLLGAGASIIGGNKAAKAQTKAANQATALSREQYNKGLELTAPFRELGIGAIPGLQSMVDQPVTPFKFRDASTYLNDYFKGPEYEALNAQAQDQILRNAAATGGFRSGGTQANLAMIAPTLGIQALQRQNSQDLQEYGTNQSANADRFNQLYGITNLGANIATGNANAGANFASQAGQNAMYAGNAKAANYMNTADALTGLGKDYASYKYGQHLGLF